MVEARKEANRPVVITCGIQYDTTAVLPESGLSKRFRNRLCGSRIRQAKISDGAIPVVIALAQDLVRLSLISSWGKDKAMRKQIILYILFISSLSVSCTMPRPR
ncbi:MAG: hypothetical protein U0T56_03270 [Ferruginibacter sp.]